MTPWWGWAEGGLYIQISDIPMAAVTAPTPSNEYYYEFEAKNTQRCTVSNKTDKPYFFHSFTCQLRIAAVVLEHRTPSGGVEVPLTS